MAHWLQHTSRDGDMQLHVHSQIAHVARTGTDGKWRAPDSLGYNEHIGAVAAIVSQHLEEALTARFGLEWTARDDGHGFEIKGISGEMMRVFSSRRESITADLRGRAARFEQRYGRAPSQRELAQLAQASNFKTRNAKHGALDLAQLHAGWADKLARTLGVSLASVAPSVWHGQSRPRRRARARRRSRGPHRARAGPRGAEGGRAGPAGKERVDPRGPDQVPGPGPAPHRHGTRPRPPRCWKTWPTGRWRSEFEPVTCLEAPEPTEVPRSLLRADGRSVYQRHGGIRYATRAQLAMEERMVAQAARGRRAARDPRAGRARARRRPGAARGRAGRTRARRARQTRARTRARADRAARGPGRRRAAAS